MQRYTLLVALFVLVIHFLVALFVIVIHFSGGVFGFGWRYVQKVK